MTSELSDVGKCHDGSQYEIHSELVRGEPRFYWIEWRAVGKASVRTDWRGSYDKRTAQRAVRRFAEAYNAGAMGGLP